MSQGERAAKAAEKAADAAGTAAVAAAVARIAAARARAGVSVEGANRDCSKLQKKADDLSLAAIAAKEAADAAAAAAIALGVVPDVAAASAVPEVSAPVEGSASTEAEEEIDEAKLASETRARSGFATYQPERRQVLRLARPSPFRIMTLYHTFTCARCPVTGAVTVPEIARDPSYSGVPVHTVSDLTAMLTIVAGLVTLVGADVTGAADKLEEHGHDVVAAHVRVLEAELRTAKGVMADEEAERAGIAVLPGTQGSYQVTPTEMAHVLALACKRGGLALNKLPELMQKQAKEATSN